MNYKLIVCTDGDIGRSLSCHSLYPSLLRHGAFHLLSSAHGFKMVHFPSAMTCLAICWVFLFCELEGVLVTRDLSSHSRSSEAIASHHSWRRCCIVFVSSIWTTSRFSTLRVHKFRCCSLAGIPSFNELKYLFQCHVLVSVTKKV